MQQSRLILLIDDDSAIRDQIEKFLRAAGFGTIQAANGLEGLKQLADSDPEMVILDINMPELDGMQTCRLIRADKKHQNIPILMLTSRGDITDMLEARKMGADDYLVKPVDPQMLMEKITRLFAR